MSIGVGLSLNNFFSRVTGGVSTITGSDAINQSLDILFKNDPGSIFFDDDNLGSRFRRLLFEPNDYILQDLVKNYAQEAINQHIQGIQLLDISLVVESHTVQVIVQYQITDTGKYGTYDSTFDRGR